MILLHTSDLHLGRSAEHDAAVERYLGRVLDRWPDPTLLVTGDILDEWSEATRGALGASILRVMLRVVEVPGNHDRSSGPLAGAVGWDEGADRAWQALGWGPRVHLVPDCGLIAIDSCQRESAFLSRANPGCPVEFGSMLARHPEIRVFAAHHDPTVQTPEQGSEVEGDGVMEHLAGRFLDWPRGQDFIDALPDGAIVLCGHIGRCRVTEVERGIRVCNMNGAVQERKVAIVDTEALTVDIREV